MSEPQDPKDRAATEPGTRRELARGPSRFVRFSLSGLLQTVFVFAVFLAFYRVASDDLEEGAFAAAAACLILGLVQQARAIHRATRQSGSVELSLRNSARLCMAWRYALAGVTFVAYAYRFARWNHLQELHLGDDIFWLFDEKSDWTGALRQPIAHSLLLLSLVVTNAPALRQTGTSRGQQLRRSLQDALAMLLGAIWLAVLLIYALALTALVHFSIRHIENLAPVWILEQDGRTWDPSVELFWSVILCSLASFAGVLAVRRLAKTWDAGFGQRLVPMAIFSTAAALQIWLLTWAFRTGLPLVSEHLWENCARGITGEIVLGGFLLLIGVTSLALRWTRSAVPVVNEPELTWRATGQFFPHEWSLLLFSLSALEVYGVLKSYWFYKDQVDVVSWLVDELEYPGLLLCLAVALTATVKLYRLWRRDEQCRYETIRPFNLAKGSAIWTCLILTALMTIPSLGLTAFMSWIVLGGLPVR